MFECLTIELNIYNINIYNSYSLYSLVIERLQLEIQVLYNLLIIYEILSLRGLYNVFLSYEIISLRFVQHIFEILPLRYRGHSLILSVPQSAETAVYILAVPQGEYINICVQHL